MTGYSIYHSNGTLLTTINIKTIDQQESSSLVLIGQGIPNYGTAIAQDFVWLLENFANTGPPVNPMMGQLWYDSSVNQMKTYNGSSWDLLITAGIAEGLIAAALNVDFTVVGSQVLFTTPTNTKKYCFTKLLLVPTGTITASGGATMNLSAVAAGDVLGDFLIPIISPSQFVNKSMTIAPEIVTNGGTLTLNITFGASGGQLHYNVYVFGAIL